MLSPTLTRIANQSGGPGNANLVTKHDMKLQASSKQSDILNESENFDGIEAKGFRTSYSFT